VDFSLTDDQEALRELTRRILADKLSEERMRAIEAGADHFDPVTWAALAEANLTGIGLPEDVGGSGYGVIEQCIVLEEIGRAVGPVPVLASIVMGASPIAAFGSAEQKRQWATPAALGEKILTAALAEPGNRSAHDPASRAEADGDSWRIDGVKTCVPAGTFADAILVPAAVDDAVGLFIVEPTTPGVTVERQRTSSREDEAGLTLVGVQVGPEALIGTVADGKRILHWLVQRATLGLVAQQLGVLGRALELTAAYTTTREQFDRPIGTFQAVSQRMADGYIDVEAVRLTLLQAMWRLSEGLPADTELAVAKFWASEAGHRVAHTAVHIHGGVGIDLDYPLQRYFVAAKKNEFTLGSSTDHLLSIGSALAAAVS
jgi:3-oxocholest-4-en-26-oyl-CoA dehydrogenase beta subunit